VGWVSLAPSFWVSSLPLSVLLWCLSWVTLNSHRCLRKRTSVVSFIHFVCPMTPFFVWCRYFADVFPLVTMLQRIHFIWSSAFTIFFCLVCDTPATSVVSS
jgi:hypothetical protein